MLATFLVFSNETISNLLERVWKILKPVICRFIKAKYILAESVFLLMANIFPFINYSNVITNGWEGSVWIWSWCRRTCGAHEPYMLNSWFITYFRNIVFSSWAVIWPVVCEMGQEIWYCCLSEDVLSKPTSCIHLLHHTWKISLLSRCKAVRYRYALH